MNFHRNVCFSAPELHVMRLANNEFLLTPHESECLKSLLNRWIIGRCNALLSEFRQNHEAPKPSLVTELRLRVAVYLSKSRVVSYEEDGGIYVLERLDSQAADHLERYVRMYATQNDFKRFLYISDLDEHATSRANCAMLYGVLSASPILSSPLWLPHLLKRLSFSYLVGEDVTDLGGGLASLQNSRADCLTIVPSSNVSKQISPESDHLEQAAGPELSYQQIRSQQSYTNENPEPCPPKPPRSSLARHLIVCADPQQLTLEFCALDAFSALIYCTNTVSIDLSRNLLESIVFHRAELLQKLVLRENRLEQLCLEPFPGLQELDLSENPLRAIDLRPAGQLRKLLLNKTRIISINMPDLPFLSKLSAYKTPLQTVDFQTQLRSLKILDVSDTRVAMLDIAALPAVEQLYVYGAPVAVALKAPPYVRVFRSNAYE